MMDRPVLWNLNWKFYDYFDESLLTKDSDTYAMIHLPHTVKELPLSYFSHEDTAMVSTYVKQLSVTPQMREQRILLVFDGVMTCFELFINGRKAGEHKGGYSKSMFDITGYCADGENRIVLRVDSHEREDIPPFGYAIDYMTFGGVYRDVWLYNCSSIFIERALIRYDLEDGKVSLRPELFLDHEGPEFEGTVHVSLKDADGTVVCAYQRSIKAGAGKSRHCLEPEWLSSPILWNPDAPYLYTVEISLESSGRIIDTHCVRTGFRTVECRPEGLFINNQKIKIMGLNRHQSYPYVGYAMGKRAQEKDADILKDYLNVNTVRTSHYMQSEYFLDRCDEIGLLVFSEIPGWGHIGGEEFRNVMLQDIESMILTQYNHPGIFIWSIHINESLDDDELYTQANEIAHSLDPSRPTTGVRYITNSHLLEDVYSLNDFTYSDCDPEGTKLFKGRQEATGLEYPVPFMITEFSGTAFPTKLWDSADKRTTHARAYARVFSHSNLSKDLLGIIGWCAFDYNTHGDYGSGDKICYHGVMDMFRIPKYAAYVLRSQKSPEDEIIMEATTEFSRGDNKGNRLVSPFMVLTNCDYIEVEMYGKAPVRYYPDNRYMGLEHPPIEIEEEIGVWQDLWQDGRIRGYYKGKAVMEKKFLRDSSLWDLEVTADDTCIYGDYTDATRIICRVIDSASTTLVYFPGVIQTQVRGPIEVIGPSVISVKGGYAAFWIRTKPELFTGKTEQAEVQIRLLNTDIDMKHVTVAVEKSGILVG